MSEQAGLKDQALQDYYESFFALYGTPGWKALMEDVALMVGTHDELAGIDTVEQLFFRKGEVSLMRWLLGHQDMVERSYADLLAKAEGAAEEAPTGGVAKTPRSEYVVNTATGSRPSARTSPAVNSDTARWASARRTAQPARRSPSGPIRERARDP
jgi:hypothetical protein